MRKVKIIAEAGVNHNGDIGLAEELVHAAHESGADIVKFQTFSAEELVTMGASQAPYQIKNTKIVETQFDMLRRLELSKDSHYRLMELSKNLGIEFLSTAFDNISLDFLINALSFKLLKIPSGEITNGSLILQSAQSGSDLIVSTGMATLEEIEDALGVIAFGFTKKRHEKPSVASFKKAFSSNEGKDLLKEKVTLLHCTTDYPAQPEDINLNAMNTLHEIFGLQVGYSDHSLGIEVSLAAVAKGANIIEKHFTMNKNLPGPDHKASLEPNELKTMIECIRNIEVSFGDGIKRPQRSELLNKSVARKSLYAKKFIKKGEIIEDSMISIKRPEEGISPMELWNLLGTEAKKDYKKGEVLK